MNNASSTNSGRPRVASPRSVRGRAEPHDAEQTKRAERLVARLHSDLVKLFNFLPPGTRSPSVMARELDIVRNTCQRSSAAVADKVPTLETLTKLPGVQGLNMLVEAVQKKFGDQSVFTDLSASIREFDALVKDLAGSHTKLIARIESTQLANNDGNALEQRHRADLVDAAAVLTGRITECQPSIYAFRQDPKNPDVLQRALAQGMIGTSLNPGGMPVLLLSGVTDVENADSSDVNNLNDEPAVGDSLSAIFQDYTSRPMPSVSTRRVNGAVSRVIDPTSLKSPVKFDIVTGLRSAHPLRSESGTHTLDDLWNIVGTPCQFLVLDVYLCPQLARTLTPSASSVLWNPGLNHPVEDTWLNALPDQPQLEQLGSGIGNARYEHYDRHADLTRDFFNALSWDPNEFVGYRIAFELPVWRSAMRIHFEES